MNNDQGYMQALERQEEGEEGEKRMIAKQEWVQSS